MNKNFKYILAGVAIVVFYFDYQYTGSLVNSIGAAVIAVLIVGYFFPRAMARKKMEEQQNQGPKAPTEAPKEGKAPATPVVKKTMKELEDEEYKNVMGYLKKRKEEKQG